MRLLLIPLALISIAACEPSQEEKERIAAVACAQIEVTREFESSLRVGLINEAREKIAGEPYLNGDLTIKEAIEFEVCEKLVLDGDYVTHLKFMVENKRKRQAASEAAAWKERLKKIADLPLSMMWKWNSEMNEWSKWVISSPLNGDAWDALKEGENSER